MAKGKLSLSHGSGGRLTWELVEEVFANAFRMGELEDAAYLDVSGPLAVTTDSFVVSPLFFPGGDIGKLSVCGTLNDLAVSGAEPLFLTCGFIMEEGLDLEVLSRVVESMAREASSAGVRIVAGDTKVVQRGRGDGIYINTTGVGRVLRRLSAADVREGDVLIVTGTVGEHGLSVFLAREQVDVDVELVSDCANLFPMLKGLLGLDGLRWMRDPTRGGLATACLELAQATGLGILLYEEKVPVREEVAFLCEMFGFDPLYLANEGKALVVVDGGCVDEALELIRSHPLGREASVVGEVVGGFSGVRLKTSVGGTRILEYLEEDTLPRIC